LRALKDSAGYVRALILALLSCWMWAAQAVDLSPEEQRMLMENLSPQEQARARDLLNQKSENKQLAPEFPQVVNPRAVDGDDAAEPAADADAAEQGDETDKQKAGGKLKGDETDKQKTGDKLKGDDKQKNKKSRAGDKTRQKLKPFGYDLFAGSPTTFAPATDIPVPADYVIGPGDSIQVQLFGKENNEYTLPVTRDGSVNFPGIGPVMVAGLRFPELQRALTQRVENQLIGMRISVSLGPLRSIRIFVLGDVQQPGSYTVSGLSTMTNALFVSGGVRTIGSLRNIQLKRNGAVVSRLDLYDLLLRGDTRGDARLQPGDVIFVPPIGMTVGVGGEVRRPAIYEVKQEKTIEDALAFAGGLLPTAYPEGSQLERINQKRERIVVGVNLTQPAAVAAPLQNGDVLRVKSVLDNLENVVRLSGEVQRPGPYQWRPGMRLSDLIPSANDLLPRSDLDYVVIKRELPPDLQIRALSTSLRLALAQPGSPADILLQPRDDVRVFSFTEDRGDAIKELNAELKQQASKEQPLPVVDVDGRVRFPGTYPLEDGMRVSDLLRAGGQLDEAAYTLQAELTRYEIVNGDFRETQHQSIDLKKVLAGDKSADALLQPHDHLNIKELPQWAEQDSVKISGEVRFPGTYPIRRGETLSAVLARAGGVTQFAYSAGAVFMREELQRREQEQLELMRQQLQDEVNNLALQQAQADPQKAQSAVLLRDLSKQIENIKPTGRLVIDLPALLAGNSNADVLLKDGDELVVPPTMQEVTVIGEVFHPTSHFYQANFSRDDYINQSGGPTNKADEKRIYVVQANGAVTAGASSAWFAKKMNDIKPGDTIVVPMDVERLRPLTLWTSISQIAYQFGLAIAAWNTVGILK